MSNMFFTNYFKNDKLLSKNRRTENSFFCFYNIMYVNVGTERIFKNQVFTLYVI